MKLSVLKWVGVLGCLILAFFMGLWWGQQKTKSLPPEGNALYAVFNDEKIWGEDVFPKIKEDLKQIEKQKYEIKKRAVLDLIKERIQSSEAPAEPAQDPEPQVFQAYLKERNIHFSKLGKKAQEDLKNNFRIHQQMLARNARLQQEIKDGQIQWHIPMTFLDPPVQVEPGFLPELAWPSTGKKVIVFGNYHCPHCPQIPGKIAALKEIFKDEISIHFRFSMQESQNSVVFLSAMAAACAHEQGKFEVYHQGLFSQPPVDAAGLTELAKKNSLDLPQFEACLQNLKFKKEILADTEAAEELGVHSRAVAFVNGYLIEIQEPLEMFEALMNQK